MRPSGYHPTGPAHSAVKSVSGGLELRLELAPPASTDADSLASKDLASFSCAQRVSRHGDAYSEKCSEYEFLPSAKKNKFSDEFGKVGKCPASRQVTDDSKTI